MISNTNLQIKRFTVDKGTGNITEIRTNQDIDYTIKGTADIPASAEWTGDISDVTNTMEGVKILNSAGTVIATVDLTVKSE